MTLTDGTIVPVNGETGTYLIHETVFFLLQVKQVKRVRRNPHRIGEKLVYGA